MTGEVEVNMEELLPHRAPMVLLSGCSSQQDADAVDAWVDISPSSPFYMPAMNGVPGCVALEYMAQAMALCVGFFRRRKGLAPKLGFVLGSRRLSILVPCFRNGERYSVRAACVYEDESFASFKCSVSDAQGSVAAEAQLSAFQPDDGFLRDKLEEFA